MADNDDLLNAINNLASINQRIANSGGKVSGDDQKKMKDLEKIIAKLSGSYKKNKNALDLNTDATDDNTDKTLKFAKGVAGRRHTNSWRIAKRSRTTYDSSWQSGCRGCSTNWRKSHF